MNFNALPNETNQSSLAAIVWEIFIFPVFFFNILGLKKLKIAITDKKIDR